LDNPERSVGVAADDSPADRRCDRAPIRDVVIGEPAVADRERVGEVSVEEGRAVAAVQGRAVAERAQPVVWSAQLDRNALGGTAGPASAPTSAPAEAG